MCKEFVVKVIIPAYTVYLFNDKDKLLLPISTNQWGAESVLMAMQNKFSARPHIHDTLRRTVTALGGEVLGAIIYKEENDIFYSYIRLLKNNEILDIDCRAMDALSLAIRCQKPILVSEEVVDKVGIKITRELLERSLGIGLGD